VKRYANLWPKIVDLNNLKQAHGRARLGKKWQRAVRNVDDNLDRKAAELRELLNSGEYQTGDYSTRTIVERGKERVIHRLPYWPDRVVQHAAVQVLAPIWQASMIRHTYASIPGRGIHDAAGTVRHQLRTDQAGTQYCLRMDIRKFYPSIPHKQMKELLRWRIKDPKVLHLLDGIVESISVTAPGIGIPIGNYLSQWFANIYLMPIDWQIKQELKVKYYHRYCDDLILLHCDKDFLHEVRDALTRELKERWALDVKGNWQAFPVAARGVDFVGYRMFHEKTLLRKSTKTRMGARLSIERSQRTPGQLHRALRSAPSYDGWTRFGSTYNLRTKLIHPYQSHLESA
jgi:RNA-directed DNA polymerase